LKLSVLKDGACGARAGQKILTVGEIESIITLLSFRESISMKKVLVGILMIAATAGLLYYFFTRNKEEGNPFLKVSGNIEATEVDVGFKVSGRIVSRSVDEGDWVEKGKVLATLDDEDLRQRLLG
jgi:multidrug efflux pump subunit AcrA (membrane-fusion protein)